MCAYNTFIIIFKLVSKQKQVSLETQIPGSHMYVYVFQSLDPDALRICQKWFLPNPASSLGHVCFGSTRLYHLSNFFLLCVL